MGCTFCATGTMGLSDNLLAGEILEQLYHANTIEPIRNVVFMGMGEPLDNYKAVIATIRAMTDVRRFGLSPSRITLSTVCAFVLIDLGEGGGFLSFSSSFPFPPPISKVGVVPRLLTLAQDAPGISLALSLHAPTQVDPTSPFKHARNWFFYLNPHHSHNTQEQRVQIVPTSKAWHIDRIMEATDAFMAMREAQSGSG